MKIHFKHFVSGYYISMRRIAKHCYNTMVFKTYVSNFTSIGIIEDIDWKDERFYKMDTNLFSALITYTNLIKEYKNISS